MEKRRDQVIYLSKIFRIDEKLEFKSDNSTNMTNNIPDYSPDKPEPKRNWLVREIPNPKFQIPNEEVSFGQILNAFGEEHTTTFLILRLVKKYFAR